MTLQNSSTSPPTLPVLSRALYCCSALTIAASVCASLRHRARPLTGKKATRRGNTSSRSWEATRMPSVRRKSSTNSTLRSPTLSAVKFFSTAPPPNSLASRFVLRAPRLISSLISCSIANTPYRPASPIGSGSEPARSAPPGSMKWFIPPTFANRSHMQADTHEPSTVDSTMSASDTKYSPGNSLTALRSNARSKYTARASPTAPDRLGAGNDAMRADLKLQPLVHGLATQREPLAAVGEVLRVTREQQASGPENRCEPLHHGVLGGAVEVDHHVAAEHRVQRQTEARQQRPERLQQVQLPELDQAGDFGAYPHHAGVGSRSAQEKAAHPLRAADLHGLVPVHAAARASQNLRVDVGGQDARVAVCPERLDRRHRDGVGFFAGRGGCTPDAGRAAGQTTREEIRKNRKMVLLPEKRGQIRRERIDELLALLRRELGVALQLIQVVSERVDPERPQPSRQTAVHHVALACAQIDSGQLEDDAANPIEVARAQVEHARIAVDAGYGRGVRERVARSHLS